MKTQKQERYKSLYHKTAMYLDWFELLELRETLKPIIKQNIEFERDFNLDLTMDKRQLSVYKKVIKAMRTYE